MRAGSRSSNRCFSSCTGAAAGYRPVKQARHTSDSLRRTAACMPSSERWASDAVNAGLFATLTTVLTFGYLLSRGIAKASRVLEQ